MISKGDYVELIELSDEYIKMGFWYGDILQVMDDDSNFPVCRVVESDSEGAELVVSISQIAEVDYLE